MNTSMMLASYMLKERKRRPSEDWTAHADDLREIRRFAARMAGAAAAIGAFIVVLGLAD